MNACVREDFVDEHGAESLPVDAITDDDTLLRESAVDHGRRSLDRDLGQIDRAEHVRGEENIVVGEGSGERQACYGHRLVGAGVGVAVGARNPGRDKGRRGIPQPEAAECRLKKVQRGARAAVVGAGIDGDPAHGELDQDTGDDDVVAVPAGVVDAEGLPIAGEEHPPVGKPGKPTDDRIAAVVGDDRHCLPDVGAAVDRQIEAAAAKVDRPSHRQSCHSGHTACLQAQRG